MTATATTVLGGHNDELRHRRGTATTYTQPENVTYAHALRRPR